MNSLLRYIGAGILTAVIVGFATYYLVNANEQSKIDDLNGQITSLQSSVDNLNKKIATATSTSSTTSTTACQSSSLLAALTDGTGGTAGTFYFPLVLKNTGTTSCVYSGSTTIALLNSAGTALGSVQTATATALTLPAGASLYSQVGFPDSGNYASNVCKAGVTTLAVYPPAQTAAVTVPEINMLRTGFTDNYCPSFSATAFSLTK